VIGHRRARVCNRLAPMMLRRMRTMVGTSGSGRFRTHGDPIPGSNLAMLTLSRFSGHPHPSPLPDPGRRRITGGEVRAGSDGRTGCSRLTHHAHNLDWSLFAGLRASWGGRAHGFHNSVAKP